MTVDHPHPTPLPVGEGTRHPHPRLYSAARLKAALSQGARAACMPVAYCRAYRLLPPGESGRYAGARRADEGNSDFAPALDPRKVSAIGHLGGLILCRLEAGGPHMPLTREAREPDDFSRRAGNCPIFASNKARLRSCVPPQPRLRSVTRDYFPAIQSRCTVFPAGSGFFR